MNHVHLCGLHTNVTEQSPFTYMHTRVHTRTHTQTSSYPVKGGSLVDVPSEPQGHHYPPCHVAEEGGAKDGCHEPVEPPLLDGVGEAGDARVEHLGIGEHRDGEDPTHHTEIQDKVAIVSTCGWRGVPLAAAGASSFPNTLTHLY